MHNGVPPGGGTPLHDLASRRLYARRERIQKPATTVGALLVGRLVTRDLLLRLAKHAGVRLTAKQATKYVPIAWQRVSGALGYAALRALGEQHIKDCVRVSTTLALAPPEPHASA